VSVTEDKTIIEELLEEAPAIREKRKKLADAKRCIAREEWDEADALYNAVLRDYPEDEAAKNGLIILHRTREQALAQERKQEMRAAKKEMRRAARDLKLAERDAKRKPHKAAPLFHTTRFLVICIAAFVLALAAIIAVVGIAEHRSSLDGLEAAGLPQEACVVTVLQTEEL